MERLVKSGAPAGGASRNGPNAHAAEALEEAIPESVKNIVLVMASAGYLVPTPKEGDDGRSAMQKTLWEGSRARLERFLPGLVGEVFVDDGNAVGTGGAGDGGNVGKEGDENVKVLGIRDATVVQGIEKGNELKEKQQQQRSSGSDGRESVPPPDAREEVSAA